MPSADIDLDFVADDSGGSDLGFVADDVSDGLGFVPDSSDSRAIDQRRAQLPATMGRWPVAPIGPAPAPPSIGDGSRPSDIGLDLDQQLETPRELRTILRGPRVASHAWQALNKPIVPLSRLAPSAQTIQDALQAISSASPELTEAESEAVLTRNAEPDTLAKVLAGVEESALGTGESLTTPFNIATLGTAALPKTIGRIVSGLFSADMASHFPDLVAALKSAVARNDTQGISKAIGDLVSTGTLTGATAKHAATKPKTPHELATERGAEMLSESTNEAEIVDALNRVADRRADVGEAGNIVDFRPDTSAERPVRVSPSMLADLQAALRGNQLRTEENTPAGPPQDRQVEQARQPAPAVVEERPPAPTAAETITGPGKGEAVPGNERTGSEIPAEREERPPQSAPASVPRRTRTEERPHDIIDELLGNVGKIDPTLIREANPDWRPVGAARELFRRDGIPADSALNAITQQGGRLGVDIDTPMDAFGDAINAAANARKASREQARAERQQLDTEAAQAASVGRARQQFEASAFEGERPKSDRTGVARVPVDSLVVGDRFKVRDQSFKVTGLEIDEDGRLLSVTVEDGPKFGVQTIEGRDVIHVDDGTMRRNRQAREKALSFVPDEEPPPAPRPETAPRPQEPAPPPTAPTIKAGQKQGDLLGSGDVEFNLYGERTGDGDRASAEARARDKSEAERKEFEAKNQQDIFSQKPAKPTMDWNALYEDLVGNLDSFSPARETGRRNYELDDMAQRFVDFAKADQSGRPLLELVTDFATGDQASAAQIKKLRAALKDQQGQGVDSFLESLKVDTKGTLHAFGVLPELWNGFIDVVRLAYRAGKTLVDAVESGLEWLRERQKGGIDEDGIRNWMVRNAPDEARVPELPGQASEERMSELANEGRQLRERIRGMRESGQEIPENVMRRFIEIDALMDEAMHSARQPRGGIPRREPAEEPAGQPIAEPPEPATPAPRPRPMAPFTGSERLPSGRLSDLFSDLTRARQGLSEFWTRREARGEITYKRDAADNRAALAANEAANHVRLILNRSFGTGARSKNSLREFALTFAIESGGDLGKLGEWHTLIADSDFGNTKWGRRALKALEYAASHWERMQDAREVYERITTAEREAELAAGVNSNEWQGGYVYHRWKQSPEGGGGVDPTRPSGAPTPFRRPREVPSYAEGLASGGTPHTLSAIELLAARVGDGQRKLNELNWLQVMRRMEDPATGEPIAVDVIRTPRQRPGQRRQQPGSEAPEEAAGQWEQSGTPEWVTKAPPGYEVFRLGDVEIAIKKGYAGLLTDLTSKSWLEGSEGRRALKKTFGFSKSMLLMFDTFHLGRLAIWKTALTGKPTYRKGQTLLDFTAGDIRDMARKGEIPADWADELVENRRRLDLAVETGFNIGQVLDNVASDWVHKIPGIGHFNEWLFGQFQRGAMTEAWLIEFERTRTQFPNRSEREIARHVTRDLNARFGNLGRQGVFKSKTGQDLARLAWLAPQWNESLIRSEIGAIKQAFRAPIDSFQQRRLVMGTLLRSAGGLALGTFLANQILNYAFRGKPTWENEEEGWPAKISAWIPDVVGNGPGFFLNPLALPAEYTHLIETQLHRSKDSADATWRIINSRLSSPARALMTLATRKDPLGRSLKPGEVLPAMGNALIPLPIPASSIGAAAQQIATGEPSEKFPGQFQKQAMSTFGIKTDQAPSDEQRIRNLARTFNAEHDVAPSPEYFAGDYDELMKALRIGNQRDARQAMEELLTKKTRKQVAEHLTRWLRAPYTGQIRREGEFLRGLSQEQRAAYVRAREKRRELARAAYQMMREMAEAAR